MSHPGGRPPARAPSELELKHLDLLVHLHARALRFSTYYDRRLEDFVLDLREAGCSARSIAKAVGVSATTVQRWTEQARQRHQSRGGGKGSSSSKPLADSEPP